MRFEVVGAEYAVQLREKFIKRFVNTDCEYFQKYCEQVGYYANGFLWDCLNNNLGWKNRCPQEQAAEFLKDRSIVYFMWDHWCEGTVFADEYRGAVIKANGAEVGRLSVDEWDAEIEAEKYDCYIEHPQLPSDIYIFDESFSWYVIFTHEFDDCDDLNDINRVCFLFSE